MMNQIKKTLKFIWKNKLFLIFLLCVAFLLMHLNKPDFTYSEEVKTNEDHVKSEQYEIPDYSESENFKQAFRKARNNYDEFFYYNYELFTTDLK